MSLFVFQQKIPFQQVIRYLRYFEPGCQTAPEKWAQRHSEDIAPGDMLFIWDPIYSPWGDASSGIGVAEGDAFKCVAMLFVTRWETGSASGYLVSGDNYEKQVVSVYLSQSAHTAKSNGVGYYYTIVRPNPALSPDRIRDLDALDRYGPSGWRSDDAANPDIPYVFFQAAGFNVQPQPGFMLDMGQLGFALFCDKEPPAGGPLPDLRPYTAPVYADARRDVTAPEGLSRPQPIVEDVVTTAEPALPRMPSFLNSLMGRPATGAESPKKSGNPLGGPSIFGNAPPPPAPGWDLGPDPSESAPPVMAPDGIPNIAGGEAENDPLMQAPQTPSWFSEQEAPEDVNETVAVEALDPTEMGLLSPGQQAEQAPVVDQPPQQVEPEIPELPAIQNQRVPKIVPPRPSGGLPPVPTRSVPPAPVSQPEPQAEPVMEQPPEEPVTQQEEPVGEAAAAAGDLNQPYLAEPPKVPGVEDIMAQIETSIRETAEAKKQEQDKPEPAPRQRPGRAQQQQASQPAAAEEAKSEEAADAAATDGGAIPPLPPKKKKPDPAEAARAQEIQNRAQLKEPMAVKSGVAGLVSKLEQQASKASTRLEQQVEEVQGRLSEELNRLLNKVSASERRSAKSAEGLRINLTGKMDSATNDVKSKVSDAAVQGTGTIRGFEQSGGAQLDEKHDYLRKSLSGSFDEVRARAETVAKNFEETIQSQAQEVNAGLDETRQQIRTQFTELLAHYDQTMQANFDAFKSRLSTVSDSITTAVKGRHSVLETQLKELRERQLAGLDQTRAMLLSKLSKQFVVAETDLVKLQASALEETVLPKLKQHREELRVVTSEFQLKLSQDLDQKSDEKIAEFQPVLEEKKEKLLELLKETTTVKDSIQEQLRSRLEEIHTELKAFVDRNIEQAKEAFKNTEEQLVEIDKAIRALADPSSIEGDTDLLDERNSVLARMDEITERAKDDVLNTLRSNVASLEEKGKHLQEELISSMEEDAYVVRRASEQALIAIREAIRDSFVAIQTAQDERMPM